MRIIDKYLLREFLLPVMYCFDAFLMLFIVQDLMENLGDFMQYHAKASQVLGYYLTILPEAVVMMLPMSLLLGVLFALSNLGKNNELVALRASGVSTLRLAVPFLLTGAVCSLLVFLVNETFVPGAKARASTFMSELRGRGSKAVMDNFFFDNTLRHRDWYARRFNTKTRELQSVEIHQRRPDNSQLFDLYAQSAVWTNGHWLFVGADIYDYSQAQEVDTRVEETNLAVLVETPRQLAVEGRQPDQLSTREIRKHIDDLKASHRKARLGEYEVAYHYRYAFPLTALVVIWLGFPLGVRTSRRGGALLGVGTALLLVVIFFFVTHIALALGRGERIPAPLAAWLTNAIFATVGAVLMARSQ